MDKLDKNKTVFSKERLEEAEAVQSLDEVNGVFEKRFNLRIHNLTGLGDTTVYQSDSHHYPTNYNNYHTVQYLPEGTIANKTKMIKEVQK